jgi:tape measure domain-containing protein
MESAFDVPIGADLGPFHQALAELNRAVRDLAASINKAFAPAKQAAREMGRVTQTATVETQKSSKSFKDLAKAAFGTIAAVAGVASSLATVAQAAPTIMRLTRMMGPMLGAALRSARSAIAGVGTQLRAVMANPTFRKIAIGAIAATAAIGGTIVAVKTAGATFRMLGTIARGVFNGINAAGRATGNALRSSLGGLKNLIPGAGGGSMLGPLAGLLGAGAAIALIVSQLKSGSDLAGQFESAQVAIGSLTGSLAGANQMIDEMKALTMQTGVEFASQTKNVQKFVALDFSPAEALKLQSNILDVAGALGLTQDEASLLGSALAQVKSKGSVAMEELRQQIAEKGVPIFKALAGVMGVSQKRLTEMVSAGEVPADRLLNIFLNMEGAFARFKGGAANLGKTWSGVINRIKAAWQFLVAEFAAPINDALKPMLEEAIEKLNSLREIAKSAGQAIGDAMLAAFAMIKSGQTLNMLRLGINVAFQSGVDVLFRGLRGAIAFLSTSLPPILDAAFAKLKDPQFWVGVVTIFQGLGQLLAAEILDALPGRANREKAALKRGGADISLDAGRGIIASAGQGDLGKVLADALIAGGVAAKAAAGGPASPEFAAALAEWNKAAGKMKGTIETLKQKSAIPAPKPVTPSAKEPEDFTSKNKEGFSLATSLARIGGGGFGMIVGPIVTQQQRTNQLLGRIDSTLKKNASPAPARAVFS